MNNLPALLSGGSFGVGEVGNIIEAQKQASYQNYIMNLMKNPAAFAALVTKMTQPLNQGLTQAVGNQVQGNLAERGLSQAPGIFAATESQALAPYYQQEQNQATSALLQLLGLPAGTFKSPSNNSGALQMFLKTLQGGGGGGGGGGSIIDAGTPQYMPTDIGPPLADVGDAPIFDPSWSG